MTTFDFVLTYIDSGLSPIPVPHKKKGPVIKDWTGLRIDKNNAEEHFNGREQNVGILMGQPSNDVVDIDLDNPHAVALAQSFLPETGAVFGRKSNPQSHRIYRAQGLHTKKFSTKSQGMLVEIRSSNEKGKPSQTIFPPSCHPSGEAIAWVDGFGEIPTVEAEELEGAVRKLAAATLLLMNWPEQGSRNDTRLAIAGALLRVGRPVEEVTHFIEVISKHGGEEQQKIPYLVQTTREKLDRREEVTGLPKLAELLGQSVADDFARFLRLDVGRTKQTPKASTPSQADIVLDILKRGELFHDGMESYIRFWVDDHYENWPVGARRTRSYALKQYHEQFGGTPNKNSVNQAIGTASALAEFSGAYHQTWIRVARQEDKIYLDLCDAQWRCIEVDAEGWRMVEDSPVRFRRGGGRPLPVPEKGGSIDLLRKHLNLRDDDQFVLLVGTIVSWFDPDTPSPMINLEGEAGSSKSFTMKLLRKLIDPCVAPGRGLPTKLDDLFVVAKNNFLITGDNVSTIKADIADALCSLCTGGGLAKRELYTDADEICLEAIRPIVLNGINIVSQRQDFLDRCVVIKMKKIEPKDRKTEGELLKNLDEDRPRILGALLDGVSSALRNIDTRPVSSLPRMADACRWIEAAGVAFGWEQGRFLEAFTRMHDGLLGDAASSDILSNTICEWLETKGMNFRFEGTATELHKALSGYLEFNHKHDILKNRYWPSSPISLGRHIRRIAPGLEILGICFEDDTDAKNRSVYRLSFSTDPNTGMESDAKITAPPF